MPETGADSNKHAPKADYKSPSEIGLEKVEIRLRSVQLALEVLTSVCATLPDPDFGADEVDEVDGR